MFIHNIDPVLFELGPISIRYYGALYAIGIMSGFFICQYFMRRRGYSDDIFNKLIIYLVVGLILGAHFGHLFFYEPESLIKNPIRIIQLGKGLASHGGFAGAIIALFLFRRRMKKMADLPAAAKKGWKPARLNFDYGQASAISYLEYTDVITIGGALLVPFIRLGNFFNSEIIGRIVSKDFPLAIAFRRTMENRGRSEADLIWRHPSQLYEMAAGILIFLLLFFLYKKLQRRIQDGTIFFSFVFLYFLSRFLIEFVKEYQALPSSFPLTMGQILSLPLIIFGVVMFIWKKSYKLKAEAQD